MTERKGENVGRYANAAQGAFIPFDPIELPPPPIFMTLINGPVGMPSAASRISSSFSVV
jgi:hypothetical protein